MYKIASIALVVMFSSTAQANYGLYSLANDSAQRLENSTVDIGDAREDLMDARAYIEAGMIYSALDTLKEVEAHIRQEIVHD